MYDGKQEGGHMPHDHFIFPLLWLKCKKRKKKEKRLDTILQMLQVSVTFDAKRVVSHLQLLEKGEAQYISEVN